MRRTALILAVALSVLTAATLAGAAVNPSGIFAQWNPDVACK